MIALAECFLQSAGVMCEGSPNFWLQENGTYLLEGMKMEKGNIWGKVSLNWTSIFLINFQGFLMADSRLSCRKRPSFCVLSWHCLLLNLRNLEGNRIVLLNNHFLVTLNNKLYVKCF